VHVFKTLVVYDFTTPTAPIQIATFPGVGADNLYEVFQMGQYLAIGILTNANGLRLYSYYNATKTLLLEAIIQADVYYLQFSPTK